MQARADSCMLVQTHRLIRTPGQELVAQGWVQREGWVQWVG
jgi:hypothetical protein